MFPVELLLIARIILKGASVQPRNLRLHAEICACSRKLRNKSCPSWLSLEDEQTWCREEVSETAIILKESPLHGYHLYVRCKL